MVSTRSGKGILRMQIPKSFKLLGRQFTVISSARHCIDCHGICNPDVNQIILSDSIPRSKRESVFCHELVHAVLSVMGEEELYLNEKFVETFGGILHQALSTMKGELE